MTPKWLLQSDFDCRYSNEIERILQSKNIEYVSGQYYDSFFWKDMPENITFFYGSISFCQRMYKLPIYKSIFDLDSLKCRNYYPKILRSLFNRDNVFITYEHLNNNREWLIDTIGDGNYIFVRPDDNNKLFTGCIVDRSTNLQRLTCETIEPNQMLVVSSPKNIDSEYRLIYIDGKFITGSQYQKNRKLNQEEVYENSECVVKFEKFFIQDRLPKMCVVDIAENDYSFGVLELGAISCAGFYDCNIEKIINAINRMNYEEAD